MRFFLKNKKIKSKKSKKKIGEKSWIATAGKKRPTPGPIFARPGFISVFEEHEKGSLAPKKNTDRPSDGLIPRRTGFIVLSYVFIGSRDEDCHESTLVSEQAVLVKKNGRGHMGKKEKKDEESIYIKHGVLCSDMHEWPLSITVCRHLHARGYWPV
jgi:hypothetical protein